MSQSDKKWSTASEIRFLEQLGSEKPPTKRILLLVKYLDTMFIRVNWQNINKNEVERKGRKLLLKLRKQI